MKSHLGLGAHLRLRVLFQEYQSLAGFSSLQLQTQVSVVLLALSRGSLSAFKVHPQLHNMRLPHNSSWCSRPPGEWWLFSPSSNTSINRVPLIRSDHPTQEERRYFPQTICYRGPTIVIPAVLAHALSVAILNPTVWTYQSSSRSQLRQVFRKDSWSANANTSLPWKSIIQSIWHPNGALS